MDTRNSWTMLDSATGNKFGVKLGHSHYWIWPVGLPEMATVFVKLPKYFVNCA